MGLLAINLEQAVGALALLALMQQTVLLGMAVLVLLPLYQAL